MLHPCRNSDLMTFSLMNSDLRLVISARIFACEVKCKTLRVQQPYLRPPSMHGLSPPGSNGRKTQEPLESSAMVGTVAIVTRLVFLFRFACSHSSPDPGSIGQPFSAADFSGHCFRLVPASCSFAASAFAFPHVQLIGFLGKDPDKRQVRDNGANFAVLSVATQQSRKEGLERRVAVQNRMASHRDLQPPRRVHRGHAPQG